MSFWLDIVVNGTPMYNFRIPSQLTSSLDVHAQRRSISREGAIRLRLVDGYWDAKRSASGG